VRLIATTVATLLCLTYSQAGVADAAVLRLTQTIPLSGVEGRIDHLAVDVAGGRLFVCALGNNSVEVLDLQSGERVHSITGLGAPQGVAYVSAENRLYVANDKGGICNIYDGKSLAPIGTIDFGDDADNVRYDNSAKRVYVGFGDGGIGIIDVGTAKTIGSIKLPKHPEAFVLEKGGRRIFANVPAVQAIAVIDRDEAKVIGTWKTGASANFPMAFDESNHRLFIGCRQPGRLVVLNADSGSAVNTVHISGDTDDVFYDENRHRLYVICGEGAVETIDQVDSDSYKVETTIRTAPGARTGLFVPELSSLFVAVPRQNGHNAEIRRYAVE
jgi:DNA-binding beta-propeller fold protein YncE